MVAEREVIVKLTVPNMEDIKKVVAQLKTEMKGLAAIKLKPSLDMSIVNKQLEVFKSSFVNNFAITLSIANLDSINRQIDGVEDRIHNLSIGNVTSTSQVNSVIRQSSPPIKDISPNEQESIKKISSSTAANPIEPPKSIITHKPTPINIPTSEPWPDRSPDLRRGVDSQMPRKNRRGQWIDAATGAYIRRGLIPKFSNTTEYELDSNKYNSSKSMNDHLSIESYIDPATQPTSINGVPINWATGRTTTIPEDRRNYIQDNISDYMSRYEDLVQKPSKVTYSYNSAMAGNQLARAEKNSSDNSVVVKYSPKKTVDDQIFQHTVGHENIHTYKIDQSISKYLSGGKEDSFAKIMGRTEYDGGSIQTQLRKNYPNFTNITSHVERNTMSKSYDKILRESLAELIPTIDPTDINKTIASFRKLDSGYISPRFVQSKTDDEIKRIYADLTKLIQDATVSFNPSKHQYTPVDPSVLGTKSPWVNALGQYSKFINPLGQHSKFINPLGNVVSKPNPVLTPMETPPTPPVLALPPGTSRYIGTPNDIAQHNYNPIPMGTNYPDRNVLALPPGSSQFTLNNQRGNQNRIPNLPPIPQPGIQYPIGLPSGLTPLGLPPGWETQWKQPAGNNYNDPPEPREVESRYEATFDVMVNTQADFLHKFNELTAGLPKGMISKTPVFWNKKSTVRNDDGTEETTNQRYAKVRLIQDTTASSILAFQDSLEERLYDLDMDVLSTEDNISGINKHRVMFNVDKSANKAYGKNAIPNKFDRTKVMGFGNISEFAKPEWGRMSVDAHERSRAASILMATPDMSGQETGENIIKQRAAAHQYMMQQQQDTTSKKNIETRKAIASQNDWMKLGLSEKTSYEDPMAPFKKHIGMAKIPTKEDVEANKMKDKSHGIGGIIDSLGSKAGVLGRMSWTFTSLAMSSLGVYFSLMGLVTMLSKGINMVLGPLGDTQALITSIGIAKSMGFDMDGFMAKLGMTMGDVVTGARRYQGAMAAVQGSLGIFGAKLIMNEQVWQAVQDIVKQIQDVLTDPKTFDLMKGIIIAFRDNLPQIINAVTWIGGIIKDWVIPNAGALAFLWTMSLVMMPALSILSYTFSMAKGLLTAVAAAKNLYAVYKGVLTLAETIEGVKIGKGARDAAAIGKAGAANKAGLIAGLEYASAVAAGIGIGLAVVDVFKYLNWDKSMEDAGLAFRNMFGGVRDAILVAFGPLMQIMAAIGNFAWTQDIKSATAAYDKAGLQIEAAKLRTAAAVTGNKSLLGAANMADSKGGAPDSSKTLAQQLATNNLLWDKKTSDNTEDIATSSIKASKTLDAVLTEMKYPTGSGKNGPSSSNFHPQKILFNGKPIDTASALGKSTESAPNTSEMLYHSFNTDVYNNEGGSPTLGTSGHSNILLSNGQYILGLAKFATGGTVPGATGQPVPILAHAGEQVLTQHQWDKVKKNLPAFATGTPSISQLIGRPDDSINPLVGGKNLAGAKLTGTAESGVSKLESSILSLTDTIKQYSSAESTKVASSKVTTTLPKGLGAVTAAGGIAGEAYIKDTYNVATGKGHTPLQQVIAQSSPLGGKGEVGSPMWEFYQKQQGKADAETLRKAMETAEATRALNAKIPYNLAANLNQISLFSGVTAQAISGGIGGPTGTSTKPNAGSVTPVNPITGQPITGTPDDVTTPTTPTTPKPTTPYPADVNIDVGNNPTWHHPAPPSDYKPTYTQPSGQQPLTSSGTSLPADGTTNRITDGYGVVPSTWAGGQSNTGITVPTTGGTNAQHNTNMDSYIREQLIFQNSVNKAKAEADASQAKIGQTGFYDAGAARGLSNSIQGFATGGKVQGALGQAVPIVAHGGEQVLTGKQWEKVQKFLPHFATGTPTLDTLTANSTKYLMYYEGIPVGVTVDDAEKYNYLSNSDKFLFRQHNKVNPGTWTGEVGIPQSALRKNTPPEAPKYVTPEQTKTQTAAQTAMEKTTKTLAKLNDGITYSSKPVVTGSGTPPDNLSGSSTSIGSRGFRKSKFRRNKASKIYEGFKPLPTQPVQPSNPILNPTIPNTPVTPTTDPYKPDTRPWWEIMGIPEPPPIPKPDPNAPPYQKSKEELGYEAEVQARKELNRKQQELVDALNIQKAKDDWAKKQEQKAQLEEQIAKDLTYRERYGAKRTNDGTISGFTSEFQQQIVDKVNNEIVLIIDRIEYDKKNGRDIGNARAVYDWAIGPLDKWWNMFRQNGSIATNLQNFGTGGTVQGGLGQAVPVIAHGGEQILTKKQWEKVQKHLPKFATGTPDLNKLQTSLTGQNSQSEFNAAFNIRQSNTGSSTPPVAASPANTTINITINGNADKDVTDDMIRKIKKELFGRGIQ